MESAGDLTHEDRHSDALAKAIEEQRCRQKVGSGPEAAGAYALSASDLGSKSSER
jgi:hypothetical protein